MLTHTWYIPPRVYESGAAAASRTLHPSYFLLSPMCGTNTPEQSLQCPHCLLHASSVQGGSVMTFEEILDQAIAMLQRRGRLTYNALKRQFQLDDATLDDLKEQLLYAHPQVVDDAGRGLVWTGEADVSPTTTPQGPQSATPGPPLTTQVAHPPQTATPSVMPPPL